MNDNIKRLKEELRVWKAALMNARTCSQVVRIGAEVTKIKAQLVAVEAAQ